LHGDLRLGAPSNGVSFTMIDDRRCAAEKILLN
jgi:hypothetical protein